MNTLRIPLASFAEKPSVTVEAVLDEPAIRPEGATALGVRDVRVSGILSSIDTELFFQGTVRGSLDGICGRCLRQTRMELALDVEWYFEPRTERAAPVDDAGELDLAEEELQDVEGATVHHYGGDTLDLAPLVWDELVLEAPSRHLCDEDCKGLCPHCGNNLNERACGCAETNASGHTGLSGLKDLFPDLPNASEE